MSDGSDKQNALLAFFSRPVVGIAGSIASIAGIVLSLYFFLVSRETPELTYLVHPVKTAVVRTGQASRLSVQFDGQNLTGNVTAAQIAFWNSGRRPIRSGAILSPLVIRTGNKARILQARLQKVSRDVIGLTMDSSRLSSGEVEVRWSILEQNDGGVLQIVYVGDEEVEIQAHAILEGQPEVVRLDYTYQLSTPGEEYARRQGGIGQLLGYFTLAMGFLMTGIFTWAYVSEGRRSQWRDPLAISTSMLMIGVGIWQVFFERPPAPPFGF
jgi:hypothetical protein